MTLLLICTVAEGPTAVIVPPTFVSFVVPNRKIPLFVASSNPWFVIDVPVTESRLINEPPVEFALMMPANSLVSPEPVEMFPSPWIRLSTLSRVWPICK